MDWQQAGRPGITMWSRPPYKLTMYFLHNGGVRADPQPYDVAVLNKFASDIIEVASKSTSTLVICEREYQKSKAAIAVTMSSLREHSFSFNNLEKAMDLIDSRIGREDFQTKILSDCVLRFMVEERFLRSVFFLSCGSERLVRFDGLRIGDGTGMPLGRFKAKRVATRLLGYGPDIPLSLDSE